LDGLARLVDKSLLAVDLSPGGETHYRLLETIRQYSREKLQKTNEEETLKRRHAHYYLAFAELGERGLLGSDAPRWSERLAAEYDNLRQAIEWSRSAAGDPELGLRLAAALWWFWNLHGPIGEGRRSLESLLAQPGAIYDARVRAKALRVAGFMAYLQGDFATARTGGAERVALYRTTNGRHGLAYALWQLGKSVLGILAQPHAEPSRALFDESVALFRTVDDPWGLAEALVWQATAAFFQGDDATVRAAGEESMAAFRAAGEVSQAAVPLHLLAWIAFRQGDLATARAYCDASMIYMRNTADKPGIAILLGTLGKLMCIQGDYPAARAAFDERQALWQKIGNHVERAHSLTWLGVTECRLGNYREAAVRLTTSLALLREQEDQPGLALCLAGLAETACGIRSLDWAAQLLGAAQSILDTIGVLPNEMDRNEYAQVVVATRAHLDETAWAAWRTHSLEQALSEAVGLAEGLRARAVAVPL